MVGDETGVIPGALGGTRDLRDGRSADEFGAELDSIGGEADREFHAQRFPLPGLRMQMDMRLMLA